MVSVSSEEYGVHFLHPLPLPAISSVVSSLLEKGRSFYYMNRFETAYLIILPILPLVDHNKIMVLLSLSQNFMSESLEQEEHHLTGISFPLASLLQMFATFLVRQQCTGSNSIFHQLGHHCNTNSTATICTQKNTSLLLDVSDVNLQN